MYDEEGPKGERKKKKDEKDRDMSKENIGTYYLNPKCMRKGVRKIGGRRRRRRKIFLLVRSVCLNPK